MGCTEQQDASISGSDPDIQFRCMLVSVGCDHTMTPVPWAITGGLRQMNHTCLSGISQRLFPGPHGEAWGPTFTGAELMSWQEVQVEGAIVSVSETPELHAGFPSQL